MNVFVLDTDPILAARMQCNKHVVKMCTEAAQLLCTALIAQGFPRQSLPYKPTHAHHPCSIWTGQSVANMNWLLIHGLELCEEYTRRYGKRHKTQGILQQIQPLIMPASWQNHTPFARAIKEPWKTQTLHLNIVDAYREFYVGDKARFAKWAPRAAAPSWWPFQE